MAGTPSSVVGPRMVSSINSEDRVRNVSPVVLMLQDDRKNLMTYLQGLGTESTDNYKFEWITDEIIPNRGTFAASAASGSVAEASTFNLSGQGTTAVYVRTDEQLYIPANGEIARVSATPASMTSVGVLRNVASGATGTIANGSLWINIGDARAAGTRLYSGVAASTFDSLSLKNEFNYNYTQTFEEPFGLHRRESKSKNYSGNDEKTQKTKALMQHCEKIEHAFWYGKRQLEAADRSSTGGVLYWQNALASGNIETIPTLTQEEFDDFVLRITRYGNRKRRVMFCSRFIATKISQWAYANQRVQSTGSSVKYGVHVDSVKTAGGCDVDIVTADALEGLPGSTTLGTHDGTAFLMDMTGKKKVVFGGDDLKYAEGLEHNDQIGDVAAAFLSDVGYKPGDVRKDGQISGVTA